MKIIYMKKAKTLLVRDDEGKNLFKQGDDKIICSNMNTAFTIVEFLSHFLGRHFFEYEKGSRRAIWHSPDELYEKRKEY